MTPTRISLINAREVSSYFDTLENSPAVATIHRLLDDAGFSDIPVFPDTEERADVTGYLEKAKDFLLENPSDIIGISCWTSGYRIAADIAFEAKRLYPDSLIIAGGPHFFSADEIGEALTLNEFDIVFRGGASPFIEFCKNYSSGKLKIEKEPGGGLIMIGAVPDSGICYKVGAGGVKISRSGSLDSAVTPVIEVNDRFADIRVISDDVCPNGCDYCVITPSRQKKDQLDLLISYSKAFSDYIHEEVDKPVRFALADSAPFAVRHKLRPLLDRFRAVSADASFSLFADPQDIDDDMFDIIDKYNVTSLFFGRDRVVEDNILGRKFRGKIRPQAMLDNELDKISSLIDFVSERKDDKACDIYLGYILSPFETASSSKIMTDEIKLFAGAKKGTSIVQANLFVLDPYPGTMVAERLNGEFIPMRMFRHPYPNAWVTPKAVHLQIELTRLLLSKLLCNEGGAELFTPFIDFINKLQYEGIADISYAETVSDPDLRSLARFTMGRIAEMDFKYEPAKDEYYDKIVDIHLLGCLIMTMLNKPEWLKKRLYNKVLDAIKDNDGILPLLKKDLELIKKHNRKII